MHSRVLLQQIVTRHLVCLMRHSNNGAVPGYHCGHLESLGYLDGFEFLYLGISGSLIADWSVFDSRVVYILLSRRCVDSVWKVVIYCLNDDGRKSNRRRGL